MEPTGDTDLAWSDGRERRTPVSVGERLYSASTANFVRKFCCSWWGLETDFFKDVFKDRNNGLFVCRREWPCGKGKGVQERRREKWGDVRASEDTGPSFRSWLQVEGPTCVPGCSEEAEESLP